MLVLVLELMLVLILVQVICTAFGGREDGKYPGTCVIGLVHDVHRSLDNPGYLHQTRCIQSKVHDVSDSSAACSLCPHDSLAAQWSSKLHEARKETRAEALDLSWHIRVRCRLSRHECATSLSGAMCIY